MNIKEDESTDNLSDTSDINIHNDKILTLIYNTI